MNSESIYIDELTGIFNRYYLKEKYKQEIRLLTKRKTTYAIAWVDIDHFKEINDIYGHIRGDKIIKAFAKFLRNSLRFSDTVVRYGGDEFVCILPYTDRQNAEWVIRRILKECKERKFGGATITISAGISSYPEDGRDFRKLLAVADEYLYDAKRSGRNQIATRDKKKKIEIPIKVFINRLEEKDRFKQSIMDAGREIKVLIVKGKIGIGKTRLGRDALSEIRGREVIWSDCLSLKENIAYYPIREAIKYRVRRTGKRILEDIPSAYRTEIGKLIPEVAEEMDGNMDGLELVVDKYRLYEGIRKVIELGEMTKIIVIDNMQWIDQESIEVIKYLARSLRNNPIKFIFIHRSDEETELFENFVSYISREINVSEIELRPFKYHEIKVIIKSIIGKEPERRLTEYIARESGGNPFFIEEIMRSLIDARYLIKENDKWQFDEPKEGIIPKSIEDIATKKYRSLNKEAQQVLEIATTIGWFDVEIIKEITGYNKEHILGLINKITRLSVAKKVRDKIEFSEGIIRNALYKKNVKGIKEIEIHRRLNTKTEK